MRDYQHEPIDYFIGDEVLDVEVISRLRCNVFRVRPVVDFVSAFYRVGYTKTGLNRQSYAARWCIFRWTLASVGKSECIMKNYGGNENAISRH